jgi:hypothetical protein
MARSPAAWLTGGQHAGYAREPRRDHAADLGSIRARQGGGLSLDLHLLHVGVATSA